MKRASAIVISAAAIVASIGEAGANQIGQPSYFTAPPAIAQFAGFYLGAVGGYTFGTAESSTPPVPGFLLDSDLEGRDGGIVAGYELQKGSYFTGIELIGALGGPQDTHTLDPFSLNYGIDAHVDARIRAGFLASDLVARYVIGGGPYARTFARLSATGFGSLSEEEWRLGWVAGAGGQFLVTRDISYGAEYTYTDLRSKHILVWSPATPISAR